MVEEEKPYHDGGDEGDNKCDEQHEVGLEPLVLSQRNTTPKTNKQRSRLIFARKGVGDYEGWGSHMKIKFCIEN